MENSEIIQIVSTVLALMVAIIGHEIMHGYMAYKYGDNTAKNAGRLSINPLVHVDPVGTIIIPGILFATGAPFLFGWAKPVPIYIREVIRNAGYKGAINVALAGIYYNFTLAVIASIVLKYMDVGTISSYFEYFIAYFILQTLVYNVVLGFFNLMPIPPLDGSHAVAYFAAWMRWDKVVNFYNMIERYGMVILILIIATPASQYFFAPIRYIISFLGP
ncbi:site-2 protease family protein [Sulfurospirillum arcachonense]|uniref:site-2 protease family protein n=1 Tax=Sulfurospirillum arcachonense TaxID=57666 RepID=UPI00046A63EF|nr:site-2 protease family protein [Sulfurospirillum arcachonense]